MNSKDCGFWGKEDVLHGEGEFPFSHNPKKPFASLRVLGEGMGSMGSGSGDDFSCVVIFQIWGNGAIGTVRG